jgi:hypothetical protein
MIGARLLSTIAVVCATGIAWLAPFPAVAQGPQSQLEIVKQFDVDKSGLLDAAERAKARQYLETLPPRGRFGPRLGGAGAVTAGAPGVPLSPADVANLAGTDLYDNPAIRTIFITFESADWEAELAAFFNTDVVVPATVIVDGVRHRDVGVRFRGNTSFSSVAAGLKRPLQLKFDEVHEGQNVEGYRTLNLLNGINDPTSLRTYLYSRISRAYLPTPKVGFVRLVINGENWGIYPNQQQFNRDFVEDFFGWRDGVRWDVPANMNGNGGMTYLGDSLDQYRRFYEIDNQDRRESWTALVRLFRVLNETPPDRLEAALAPLLDIDGALRFLAVDVALANSDGYWSRGSDYSIYLDPGGRFHVVAHDMNEALGVGRGGPQLDPLVAMTDPGKALRSRLLAVPSLRKRYLEYVLDVATNWLDWEKLGAIAREQRDLIAADVRRDTRKLFTHDAFLAGFDDGGGSLRAFADARREYLLAEVPRLIAATGVR